MGVVGDVKGDSLSGSAEPSLYLPMRQSFGQEMTVVVRATHDADAGRIASGLRGAIAEIDPTVPVSGVRSLDGLVADSAARARFATTLLALFAAVALLLGVAGAVASARLMRGVLFGVRAIDATVLAAVAGLLGVVAIVAALGPARRASRVDPLRAIRAE